MCWQTIEYYLSDKKREDFAWGHRFGLDWENAQAESAPGKEAMRAYQKDVEQLLHRVLGGKTDQDLAAPETTPPLDRQDLPGQVALPDAPHPAAYRRHQPRLALQRLRCARVALSSGTRRTL